MHYDTPVALACSTSVRLLIFIALLSISLTIRLILKITLVLFTSMTWPCCQSLAAPSDIPPQRTDEVRSDKIPSVTSSA
ncbi:hypothetical protein RvY_00983 [Ramazzottius varieornatus]|uniref:Uncharacterized protein n=1 Tax=Ramazzottius varieornatus TaxID=947166 RepID=A0A1D1UEP9_RAMVA|nr:hypothetical protein RvY_00983 [Ramazzottius varieornatus]